MPSRACLSLAPQIQLMVPCTITEIHVSDSRPEEKGQSSSVLQAYARDESCAQAARFAPLLTAPLACAAGATQKISTEVGQPARRLRFVRQRSRERTQSAPSQSTA